MPFMSETGCRDGSNLFLKLNRGVMQREAPKYANLAPRAYMHMLFPERGTGGELLLLAFRGFNP
jgi:hypothetical protein